MGRSCGMYESEKKYVQDFREKARMKKTARKN
jgi:hypothetical protein